MADLSRLENHLHQVVASHLGGARNGRNGRFRMPDRERLKTLVGRALQKQEVLLPASEKDRIICAVVNRILGLGPLEPLLGDPQITEVMVNQTDRIFVERFGRLEPVLDRFSSQEQLLQVIDRIVAPLGRRVDESVPFVDARLPDGSRVNAVIPPLSLDSPVLTIRRFGQTPFTLERLINLGSLTCEMAEFLSACVRSRLNLVISGGTGSGKTSTLNALAREIPADERLISIEDVAELQLGAANLVRLEARPPNLEGRGEVSIRSLLRNALRMRPDRIIVGEVRGAEAFDMLQAMNTGHPGSLTSVHANSPEDALRRLEAMVVMAGLDLPQSFIQEQILSAVDIILQQQRLPDGSRMIMEISEVITPEGNRPGSSAARIRPVFRYQILAETEDPGKSGTYWVSPRPPACLGKIREQRLLKERSQGVKLP